MFGIIIAIKVGLLIKQIMNMKALVITENESSEFVRILYRKKHTAFIRRNIISALDLLKHEKIELLIIDKSNVVEDLLEFVLNTYDVAVQIKILVHSDLTHDRSWKNITPLGHFVESVKPDFFTERLNELEKTSN